VFVRERESGVVVQRQVCVCVSDRERERERCGGAEARVASQDVGRRREYLLNL